MRTSAHFIHVVFALVFISCTNTASTQPTPTSIIATLTPTHDVSADIAAEIRAYQTRWRDANIRHYRYQLTVSCFCPMNAVMPITIEVNNDVVTSITDARGVPVSPDDAGSGFFLKYTTISRIYAELTSSWFSTADKLSVTYDSTYPVPATISADFIAMAVDDELYVGVSGFTPRE